MDPTLIAAILGAGGLTVLVPQLITGIRGMIDGHHAQEKAENVDALAQRDRADRCRRVMVEHAATVRRIAIEHGIGRHLPPWPGENGDRPPAEPPGDGQPSDDPTT